MLKIETTSKDRAQRIIAEGIHPEFFTWWDDITLEEVHLFEQVIGDAPDERAIQKHLEKNPTLIVQHLNYGHGRWVIPQKRLGAEFVCDFVIGQRGSLGYKWCAVELESPTAKPFTKAGNPSAILTHAIRQIQDWRSWLKVNQNYAARTKREGGLDLPDIGQNIPGLILIGRRSGYSADWNKYRLQFLENSNIEIRSYDYLIDVAKERALWFQSVSHSRVSPREG